MYVIYSMAIYSLSVAIDKSTKSPNIEVSGSKTANNCRQNPLKATKHFNAKPYSRVTLQKNLPKHAHIV